VFDGTDWWMVQVTNPGDGVRLRSRLDSGRSPTRPARLYMQTVTQPEVRFAAAEDRTTTRESGLAGRLKT
jgi:hypothetical protein